LVEWGDNPLGIVIKKTQKKMSDTIYTNSEIPASAENSSPVGGSSGNSTQDGSFDVRRYLQILYIHKWKFLAIVLLILILAIIYALNQPKYFVADYEVFYNEANREFIMQSNVPVLKSDFDKNYWLSTMKSDEVARLTLKNSGLPYNVEIIKQLISVEMVDKKDQSATPIFKVTITSKRNDIMPILIKAFVQSLNDILIKNQINNSDKLVTYLSKQLNENNNKLGQIDQDLLMDGTNNPAKIQDINKLTTDLSAFRTDLLNTQINLSSALASKQRTEQELKNLDGTIVNESAFSEPLKVQLMNLQVDLARALTKNKENHPAIKAIRDNIGQLQRMLRDSIQEKLEIKSLIQNPLKSQLMSKLMELEINVIALQTRVLSLQKVIGEFEAKMVPDTTDENNHQKLRNRELVSMTINLLNSKLIEAQSAAQGSLSRFVLIDEPEIPLVPASKSRLLIILFGFLIGLLIAGLAVFVYDLIDNRLMLVSDYENFFTIPLLGTLLNKRKPEDYYRNLNDSNVSYKRTNELGEIVVNMKKILKDPSKKLFSICSPVRREGKSMASIQLAYALADKGLRVLLVDMDVFIPKLTVKMKMQNEVGLVNYVRGENSLSDILHQTDNSNLFFTGVGKADNRADFQYDSPEFVRFAHQVKEQFDVVIFDTPAILYIPDIVTFMDMMDQVIIVVRLMHTTRRSLDKLLKLIGSHRGKIAGTIINDLKLSKLNQHSEYYHYGYEYGYNERGEKQRKQRKTENETIRVA